jgi:DNA polymerase III sliding clamp (beta) subunit (PCNA family)
MKFANYRAIIPADFDSNLTIDRDAFITALEKCNISSNPFKSTTLNIKKDMVNFNSNDDQFNIDISVDVPATYTGKLSQIKIASDKMLKMINQVDFENIELAIHHDKRAIIIRASDDKGYLGLVMPLTA